MEISGQRYLSTRTSTLITYSRTLKLSWVGD